MAVTPKPISPTFIGDLPSLQISLDLCEIGDPCRTGRPAQEGMARDAARRAEPGYICRIHRVRRFFVQLGWMEGK